MVKCFTTVDKFWSTPKNESKKRHYFFKIPDFQIGKVSLDVNLCKALVCEFIECVPGRVFVKLFVRQSRRFMCLGSRAGEFSSNIVYVAADARETYSVEYI